MRRRSGSAKGAAGARDRSASARRPPRFRRPSEDLVRFAARRALGRVGRPDASQAALRRALLPLLAEEDPKFAIGPSRLRRLLLDAPGVRMEVRYAEKGSRLASTDLCPVCRSPLLPIQNRTLDGDPIVLGYRCTRCAYWTHLKRRVPVRYRFTRSGRPTRSREDPASRPRSTS